MTEAYLCHILVFLLSQLALIVNVREMITELALAVCVYLIFTILAKTFRMRKSELKSPPSIPLLGHLNVFVNTKPLYMIFADHTNTYGTVFQFRFFSSKILILNDAESVRDACRSEDFAGRPNIYSLSLLSRNNTGIAFCDFSRSWKFHKRYLGSALQSYMRPVMEVQDHRKISVCEKAVWDEIENLINVWKSAGSREIDTLADLQFSLLNIVCNLTFSRRYQPQHQEFKDFMVANQNLKKLFRPWHPLDVFPILKVSKSCIMCLLVC